MQYAELKKGLVIEYKYDRDGYLVAKNDFINKYTKIAIDYYKDKL